MIDLISMGSEIPVSKLIISAKKAYENAYAPYSNFRVGVALVSKKGNIYTGCNVEFVDYLALHAELNAIGSAVNSGETDIITVVVYSSCSPPVLPCGSCRQKLLEFSKLHDHDITIIAVNNNDEKIKHLLSDLLPFGNIPVEK
ncbi:Cytidine deaminase [subsurface metagenome]